MHFPIYKGVLRRRVGEIKAVDDVSFEIARGRDAGARRRVGLRQVDHRPGDPAALRADRRLDRARGPRDRPARGRRAAGAAAADADDLPGPAGEPQPAHDRRARSSPSRSTSTPSSAEAERRARVMELMDAVGLNRALRQPLPARVLRRPAPAHRHRPGAGAEPEVHRLRRADRRARRLDPGAGGEPARGPAGEVRADLSLHQPRPLAWCATSRPGSR